MNKIFYSFFLVSLFMCAILVLYAIWTPTQEPPFLLPRLIGTSFVIGLGSFLLWFTSLFWRLYREVCKK
jgi:hypothetical protein